MEQNDGAAAYRAVRGELCCGHDGGRGVTFSALSGWIACALVPLAALSGWILRRFARGRYALRMRPHYLLGYGAAALAGAHAWTSAGGMAGADALGIWLATFGLGAMLLQAFLGLSLQSPGAYRIGLRRWHVLTFAAVAVLVIGHLALNGPVGAGATALATVR